MPLADRVSAAGLLAAVAVLFAVSGGMLWVVGYNYDGLTGSPITKIHPFTYMVGALFAWRLLASGHPVGHLVQIVERKPAAMLMGVAGLVMLVTTALRQGSGMAGFMDTYVGPALLVLLLAEADARTLGRITVLLHVMMTANAVLALIEFATRTLVFPYRLDGSVFPTDLRASALGGHPLVNASITACYVLGLLSGARGLPPVMRMGMIALQCAALVTFGGRSGLVVTLLFGTVFLAVTAMRSLRGGRIPLLGAAIGILLVTLAPVLVGVMSQAGFFDAVLARFASDGGSANARVEMFELFKGIPLRSLVIGPDIGLVDSLRRINGLEWGIENPVVRLVLYQGAALTLMLLVAFGLFMVEMALEREPGVWLPVLGCLILLNTAESIGAKTTLLAKFVVIVVGLYGRRSDRAAAPAVTAAATPAPAPR